MEQEIFEVYVTVYALTKGIQKRKVKTTCVEGMLGDVENSFLNYHTEGKDWHRTFENALKKANEMKQKKIASVKKQLVKLEKLQFKES